jgi:hypothetical protein
LSDDVSIIADARAPASSDSRKLLTERVWAALGYQCGKYLAVSMRTLLGGLESYDELVAGQQD